jgi:hypothetical protein
MQQAAAQFYIALDLWLAQRGKMMMKKTQTVLPPLAIAI